MGRIKSHTTLTTFAAATLIAAMLIFGSFLDAKAQTDIFFPQGTEFTIPDHNGTIRFASNGTYSEATLQNGSWFFRNLTMFNSQMLDNFSVSVQNSSITILSYRITNVALWTGRISYVAENAGTQTFNLGINPKAGEWNVIINREYKGKGDMWTLASDGTVKVTGAVGNVSIVWYSFNGVFGDLENQPFYQQHSVIIGTAIAVTVIVILVVAHKLKHKASAPPENSKMNGMISEDTSWEVPS